MHLFLYCYSTKVSLSDPILVYSLGSQFSNGITRRTCACHHCHHCYQLKGYLRTSKRATGCVYCSQVSGWQKRFLPRVGPPRPNSTLLHAFCKEKMDKERDGGKPTRQRHVLLCSRLWHDLVRRGTIFGSSAAAALSAASSSFSGLGTFLVPCFEAIKGNATHHRCCTLQSHTSA
jgi:hypothetical protein